LGDFNVFKLQQLHLGLSANGQAFVESHLNKHCDLSCSIVVPKSIPELLPGRVGDANFNKWI